MDSNKIESIEMNLDDFLIDHIMQSNFLKAIVITNKNKFNKLSHTNIGNYLAKKIKTIKQVIVTNNYLFYKSIIDITKLLGVVNLDFERGWKYFINNKLYNLDNFSNKLLKNYGVEIQIKILLCSFQSVFAHSKLYLEKIINNGKFGTNADYIIKEDPNSMFNVFVNIENDIITFSLNIIYKIWRATDELRNIIKVVYNTIDIDLTKNKYETHFIVFPNILIVQNYLQNLKKSKNKINLNFNTDFNTDLLKEEPGQTRAWSYVFINKDINNSNPQTRNTCIKKIKEMNESKELAIKYLLSQKETLDTQVDIIKIFNPFGSELINYKKKIFYKKIYNKHSEKIFFQSYYIYQIKLDDKVLFNIHVYKLVDITNNILERYIVYEVLDKFISNLNIKELIKLKFEYKDDTNQSKNTTLDNIIKFYINQSNTNTNILPKLNEILRKITIGRNIKPSTNNISQFLNNITQTLPMLNKNKLFPSKQSDFLLINFNEAAQSYNYSDCLPMIIKVLTEKPKIIVVCTQDSASKRLQHSKWLSPFSSNHHYQHVLGEILKSLYYNVKEKIDGSNTENLLRTKLLRKFSSRTVHNDKGIRTRIYFSSDFDNSQQKSESTKLNLGTFTERSLYDGAILTKLDFKVSEKDYKIAIVNCNLYYEHKPQTGLEKRIEEFNRIVKEFGLIQLSKDHDIFFCGDTNFRLFTHTKTNSNINSFDVIRSRQNVKSYIDNKKSLNERNEFYLVLKKNFLKKNSGNLPKKFNEDFNNLKKRHNNLRENENLSNQNFYQKLLKSFYQKLLKSFYQKLLKSMDLLGTHLTSKYMVDKTRYMYKEQLELFRLLKNSITDKSINSVFNINPKKNKNIRVPSQTDRILFALKNETSIAIDSNDFNIHLFPDKSDHKMISLTFNFESVIPKVISSNNSNNSNNNIYIIPESITENNSITALNYKNIESSKRTFIDGLFSLFKSSSNKNSIQTFKSKLTNIHNTYKTDLEKQIIKVEEPIIKVEEPIINSS